MTISIQPAVLEDILGIQKLAVEFSKTEIDLGFDTSPEGFTTTQAKKYLEGFISKRKKCLFLAKNTRGTVIGFTFGELTDEWWTTNPVKGDAVMLFVTKKYRNKGIGKQLHDKRQEWFVFKGVSVVVSSMFSINKGSIKFHKREGMKPYKTIMKREL